MGRGVALLRAALKALGGELALPYLPDSATALLGLLDFKLDEDLRKNSVEGFAELVGVARKGLEAIKGKPEASAGLDWLRGILGSFLEKSVGWIQAETTSAKKVKNLALGLGPAVQEAGPGVLPDQGVMSLSQTAMRLLEASLVRSAALTAAGSTEEEEDEDAE